MPVLCNEDEDAASQQYNILFELTTEPGVDYRMLIEGWSTSAGEYCLEVTNLSPSSVVEADVLPLTVFPNPTTGLISWEGVQAEREEVFDQAGRLQGAFQTPGQYLDLSDWSAGLYLLRVYAGATVYTSKIVKQ